MIKVRPFQSPLGFERRRTHVRSSVKFKGLGPTLHRHHVLAQVRGQDPQGETRRAKG